MTKLMEVDPIALQEAIDRLDEAIDSLEKKVALLAKRLAAIEEDEEGE